jgi:hypothetical protein
MLLSSGTFIPVVHFCNKIAAHNTAILHLLPSFYNDSFYFLHQDSQRVSFGNALGCCHVYLKRRSDKLVSKILRVVYPSFLLQEQESSSNAP